MCVWVGGWVRGMGGGEEAAAAWGAQAGRRCCLQRRACPAHLDARAGVCGVDARASQGKGQPCSHAQQQEAGSAAAHASDHRRPPWQGSPAMHEGHSLGHAAPQNCMPACSRRTAPGTQPARTCSGNHGAHHDEEEGDGDGGGVEHVAVGDVHTKPAARRQPRPQHEPHRQLLRHGPPHASPGGAHGARGQAADDLDGRLVAGIAARAHLRRQGPRQRWVGMRHATLALSRRCQEGPRRSAATSSALLRGGAAPVPPPPPPAPPTSMVRKRVTTRWSLSSSWYESSTKDDMD